MGWGQAAGRVMCRRFTQGAEALAGVVAAVLPGPVATVAAGVVGVQQVCS